VSGASKDNGELPFWFRLVRVGIIQSIPSPKAEPFKQWLAHVGLERIKEIEDPELAQERMKEIYKQKGYSKSWIDKRLRGIAVRQDLTDEWQKRGINEHLEFAILTAEISKSSFGLTPSEWKTRSKKTLRYCVVDSTLNPLKQLVQV
jgi:hypothetical protein